MTINVISDLHCGGKFKDGDYKIVWNSSDNICKNCIQKFQLILSDINKNRQMLLDSDKRKTKEKILDKTIKDILYLMSLVQENPKSIKIDQYNELLNKNEKCKDYFNILKDPWDYTRAFYAFGVWLDSLYCDFDPSMLEPADYLIVCGDLGLDMFYDKVYQDLKEKTKDKFKDIFYIKGNHDYWWFKDGDEERPDNINLDHRFVEHDVGDYVFLGCTMWAPVKDKPYSVYRCMNDYRYIPNYNIDKTNELHKVEAEWLREKVNYYKSLGKKVIVFTHHIPRKELINKKYLYSEYNEAYYVMDESCNDIKPDIWCTGHAHTYHDRVIDGVRYVCNPIGYRSHYGYSPSEVKPDHWYNTVIEV